MNEPDERANTSHIGIDASRIAVAARTGTEHYTYELLAALARRDRQNRYTLYCNQMPSALPPAWPERRAAAHAVPAPVDARPALGRAAGPRARCALFVPAHVLPLRRAAAPGMRTVVTIHDMGYLRFPEAHTAAQRLYLRLSTIWRRARRLAADRDLDRHARRSAALHRRVPSEDHGGPPRPRRRASARLQYAATLAAVQGY